MFILNSFPRRLWNRLLRGPNCLFFQPYYRNLFCNYGKNNKWGREDTLFIPSNIKIACPENISIGDNCQFDEYTHLLATPHSQLTIGNNVRFANGFAHVIASFDEIIIEDNCLFAAFVLITNGNHGYKDINQPIKKQDSYSTGPITIKQGCWIGRGSCVLGGVTLGRNVVVGANAVVTESIPDYSVVAGNPAVIIKKFNLATAQWERTITVSTNI